MSIIINKNINKYIPKLISKFTYIDMENQIQQAERGTLEQCNLKKEIEKNFNLHKKDSEIIIKLKEKEIKKLEEKLQQENAKCIDLAAELSSLKIDYETAQENILKSKEKLRTLNGAKGGYTKEIKKLKKAIANYEIKIAELEKKNNVQASKIRELSAAQEHIMEEYQNNGLPSQSKKALKNKKRKGVK